MPVSGIPGFREVTETKVVRIGADTRKRCYISKVYKSHRIMGALSILWEHFDELIPGTERAKAFILVTISRSSSWNWNIVISDFLPEPCSLAAFLSAYSIVPWVRLQRRTSA